MSCEESGWFNQELPQDSLIPVCRCADSSNQVCVDRNWARHVTTVKWSYTVSPVETDTMEGSARWLTRCRGRMERAGYDEGHVDTGGASSAIKSIPKIDDGSEGKRGCKEDKNAPTSGTIARHRTCRYAPRSTTASSRIKEGYDECRLAGVGYRLAMCFQCACELRRCLLVLRRCRVPYSRPESIGGDSRWPSSKRVEVPRVKSEVVERGTVRTVNFPGRLEPEGRRGRVRVTFCGEDGASRTNCAVRSQNAQ